MKINFKEGKGDKIHILIDGEYKFTVDKTYFALMGLYQNKEIDKEELEKIAEEIEKRRAYNQAVSYLSRRDHSERELLTKLRQKGYSDSAEYAVEKLKKDGFVDDERFSRMYAKELITLKKYGKRRIEQELYKKGISRDIISLVLEETDFDENDLCDIIRRKYYRYLSDEKGVKKTVNALLRMGYSYSEIRSALQEFTEDNGTDYEVSDE